MPADLPSLCAFRVSELLVLPVLCPLDRSAFADAWRNLQLRLYRELQVSTLRYATDEMTRVME